MADTNSLIAQGIANLTKLFTPPSGQEYYAYAHAGQLRADEERKQAGLASIERLYGPEAAAVARALGAQGFAHFPQVDLYNRSRQPGATPRSLDASLAAIFGANNTFEGIDTKERGMNARNAADNTTRTNIAGMEIKGRDVNNQRDNTRALTQSLVTPVGPNAIRYIPDNVAGAYNLPPMQYGTQELDPGKQYVVPGPGGTSTRVDGPPAVLTTDQQAARDLGTLSVEDRLRFLLAKNKLTTQPGPSGGPSMSTVQPAAPPAAYQSRTVILPDKTQVQGRFDPRSGVTTLADGSPLPAGSVVSSTPSVQAASPSVLSPVAKSQVDVQLKNLAMTESVLNPLYDLYAKNPALIGAPGVIRQLAQNLMATSSDVARLFEDSKSQLIQDLRSGAFEPDALRELTKNGFDPAIPAADMLSHLLVAQVAKMYVDDNGKVSVFSLQQARRALGLDGTLANSGDVMKRLDVLRQQIAAQRKILEPARPGTAGVFPGQQPAPPGAPPVTAPAPGAPPAAPAPTAPAAPPGLPPLPPGLTLDPPR